MVRNRIDGFIDDLVATNYLIKQLGYSELIKVQPVHIFSTDLHIIFSKKSVDQETITQFNDAMLVLKNNGKYQKIIDKYLIKN